MIRTKMKILLILDLFVAWGLLCMVSSAPIGKIVLKVPLNSHVGFFEYWNNSGIFCGDNETTDFYRDSWIDTLPELKFNEFCVNQIEVIFESYPKASVKYSGIPNTTLGDILSSNKNWGKIENSVVENLNGMINYRNYEFILVDKNNSKMLMGIYTDKSAVSWPQVIYGNSSIVNDDVDPLKLENISTAANVFVKVYINNVTECLSPFVNRAKNRTEQCPRPPVVRIPKQDYMLSTNTTMYLKCNVTSIPPATRIYWKKNDTEINISAHDRYELSPDDNSSLVLTDPDHSNLGIYQCCAMNDYKNTTVCGTSMMIKGPPFIFTNNTLYDYEESKTVILNCKFTSYPAANDNYWLNVKGNHTVGTSPTASDTSGNMYLEIANMTDKDLGTYYCCVKNNVNTTCAGPIQLAEPMCPCSCEYRDRLDYWEKNPLPNHTMDEWREILADVTAEIRKNLSIDVSTTSASIRRRTSAPDKRKSSESVGIVGITLISLFLGSFLVFDILAIRHHMAQIREMGNR